MKSRNSRGPIHHRLLISSTESGHDIFRFQEGTLPDDTDQVHLYLVDSHQLETVEVSESSRVVGGSEMDNV